MLWFASLCMSCVAALYDDTGILAEWRQRWWCGGGEGGEGGVVVRILVRYAFASVSSQNSLVCFSTTQFDCEKNHCTAYIIRHFHVNLIKCTRFTSAVPLCFDFSHFIPKFDSTLSQHNNEEFTIQRNRVQYVDSPTDIHIVVICASHNQNKGIHSNLSKFVLIISRLLQHEDVNSCESRKMWIHWVKF